jgi:hypothetical protein
LHRTKKTTVTSTAVALLMAAGMTSAMAARNDDNDNGDDNGHDNGDCVASSTSGNQTGLVNLHADNLAATAFCQSEILNDLAVPVFGFSFGGSQFGSGLLAGGPGGLLSGLFTADADVLANVLVQF